MPINLKQEIRDILEGCSESQGIYEDYYYIERNPVVNMLVDYVQTWIDKLKNCYNCNLKYAYDESEDDPCDECSNCNKWQSKEEGQT